MVWLLTSMFLYLVVVWLLTVVIDEPDSPLHTWDYVFIAVWPITISYAIIETMKFKTRVIIWLVVSLGIFLPSWIIYGNISEIWYFPVCVILLGILYELIIYHNREE